MFKRTQQAFMTVINWDRVGVWHPGSHTSGGNEEVEQVPGVVGGPECAQRRAGHHLDVLGPVLGLADQEDNEGGAEHRRRHRQAQHRQQIACATWQARRLQQDKQQTPSSRNQACRWSGPRRGFPTQEYSAAKLGYCVTSLNTRPDAWSNCYLAVIWTSMASSSTTSGSGVVQAVLL